MNWWKLLIMFLENLPEPAKGKLFDLYHDYKSMMEKLDKQLADLLPDSIEVAAILEVHKALANAFLHNALKICKDFGWYTHEAFDVALPLAQHLFQLPVEYKPDWWDESYADV